MTIKGVTLVRITRDAEVELEDDLISGIRELVEEQIRQRRYEPVVRLEFGPGADPAVKDLLRERFKLTPEDLYDMPEEVDYTMLFELMGLPLSDLKDSPWTPLQPPGLPSGHAAAIFRHSSGRHPASIIPTKASTPASNTSSALLQTILQTVSIKMTAYRIGDDTPFVKSLMRAAEAGKQVACVMEIKARFDEERNLHWAAELERVGAHVTFGIGGLKTHGKTALVVRREAGGLRSYVHIGTGNYHVKTARLYADLGVLTCDPRLTKDVVNLFHYLTGHAQAPAVNSILVAPSTMRPRMLQLIAREIEHHRAGKPARIIAKMNQLEDPDMINALIDASQAGVPIDLIIRGFCCLRPGVKGVTENIRIRSIIGRFLEHSRVFHFANGHKKHVDGEFYIGSADWMYRNLSKRVEVVTPIYAHTGKKRLWEFLDILLRDQRQAWTLGSDGKYTQLTPPAEGDGPEVLGTHQTLMNLTREHVEG